jgi:ATP-dependent Clp protease ATP-binding subunit ClpA
MVFYARFLANTGTLVEAHHLFMGLAHADADLINCLLGPAMEQKMRQTFERLAENIEKPPFRANISLSNDSKRIVELAAEEADRLQHANISTGHFLLGFLREESSVASSLLTSLMRERGMSIAAARDQITPLLEL